MDLLMRLSRTSIISYYGAPSSAVLLASPELIISLHNLSKVPSLIQNESMIALI